MAVINSVGNNLTGQTGTGAFVGSNSPDITSPEINQIYDENGNIILNFSPQTSAVNYLQISNSPAGSGPAIAATGSDVNIPITLNTKGNEGCNIKGVGTNLNAPTGYLGEVVTSAIAAGGALPLTSGVALNITSISLTAGDWNISGSVAYTSAATTNITQLRGGYNDTSMTFPGNIVGLDYNATYNNYAPYVPGATTSVLPLVQGRLLLSTTTTVYLIASGVFTVATLSAFGMIQARRRS